MTDTDDEIQLRRMETAYGIIQHVSWDPSLTKVANAIVENLVDLGGFVRAAMTLDLPIGGVPFHHAALAGKAVDPTWPTQRLPIVIRATEIGTLETTCAPAAASTFELLEWLMPTFVMAIDNAVQFGEANAYKATLELRVEQRTAELARAVADLEQAQAVRSRIFANINHEIRTPLSLVMLASSEIRNRYQSRQDAKTIASVSNIENACERLLNMVDSMLLLAAGQEGKLRIRARQTDVAADVRRTVSVWLPHAKSNKLALSYSGPEKLIGDVDSAALDRVLANLISNAIKYTPDDGCVEVGLGADEHEMWVHVRDTGIGIDEDFKKRIFGRFEQGRAAVRHGSRSSGIGLSIVKELVEGHSGAVSVDNAPGGGSIFEVRLPRRANPMTPEEESTGSVVPQHIITAGFGIATEARATAQVVDSETAPIATLLIAEDDNGLRSSIGSLLVDAGYRVLLAPDGFAALQMAREQYPDMLVSDVGMPGMDGLELSRRFRDLPGNRLAPVLLLTAFGTAADKLMGFQAGAIDYVTKPFDPKELIARVDSQLKLRDMALRLLRSEKLASLGTLSAGLAHELRNPANGLLNALDPLFSMLPPEVLQADSGTGQLLDVIRDCAQQVGRLSRQLLGFKNDGAVSCTDESVQHLVRRALAMLASNAGGVEQRVRHAYGGTVRCAGPMIVQVLVNLLDNAIQAAGRGGWVEVLTRLDGDKVVIEISDSGPGVPSDLRERIFEPFFTTKPPGLGTGLGLSTARLIVEQHRGNVRVAPGPRSTFMLELPLNGPEAPS